MIHSENIEGCNIALRYADMAPNLGDAQHVQADHLMNESELGDADRAMIIGCSDGAVRDI